MSVEGSVHPLAEARAHQEQADLKSKLSQIIYQGIVDRLKFGPVHADDLEGLFPEERRSMCRRLVGAQFGSLASRGYIVERERRKSKVASRRGAKSGVYEFTKAGWDRWGTAGVSASNDEGHCPPSSHGVGAAGTHSGDSDLTGPGDGSAGQLPGKRDQGRPEDPPSFASAAPPDNVQGGRDRQVRGAGCDEGRSASALTEGAGAQPTGTDKSRRNSQPARLLDDKTLTGVQGVKDPQEQEGKAVGSRVSLHPGENKPLSLLPEPDPEAWAA